MPRKKRHKFEFDEESVNKLLQEIYDDSRNLKAKITRLYNQWVEKAKEGGEIQAIGDTIVKLINAESKNQDQKIMLLKHLKDVVYAEKNSDEGEKSQVKDEARNNLIQMIENQKKKK